MSWCKLDGRLLESTKKSPCITMCSSRRTHSINKVSNLAPHENSNDKLRDKKQRNSFTTKGAHCVKVMVQSAIKKQFIHNHYIAQNTTDTFKCLT